MMWELPQVTILQINSLNVGTHTFKKFFPNKLTLKWDLNFDDDHKTTILCKNRMDDDSFSIS